MGYRQILEEKVFNILLSEAKSQEEVLNILSKKYDGKVSPNVIKQIMDFDPTKKFSYTQWAIRALLTNPNDAVNYNALRSLFAYAKGNNDFQLQTFSSISDAVDGMNEYRGKSEYEVVYEDEEWVIYIPHSYQAERYIVHHLYGGASWCTASSNGEIYYDNYSRNGNELYIFADKKNGDIYQYSPLSNEFNDSDNSQVESPRELVGENVYAWFEERGMYIDKGTFPGPDDIMSEEGNYGLRCINDLYSKYVLCDNRGQELSHREYSNPTNIKEYEGTICVISKLNDMTYWEFIKKDGYVNIDYFDDRETEPYFLEQGSVLGISDGCYFRHISLLNGKNYCGISDIDNFERIETGHFILRNSYHDEYTLYDPWKYEQCYYERDGINHIVTWYDSPYYDERSGFLIGGDGNGGEISYNPKTGEYHSDDDDGGSGAEAYDMSENIKKRFNTILEKINKNYNIDRLKE